MGFADGFPAATEGVLVVTVGSCDEKKESECCGKVRRNARVREVE